MRIEKYERLTADKICTEGCINILEAFLVSVGVEYRHALRAHCEDPNDESCKERYEASRDFILSNYFKRLTNLDGQGIIDTLNRDYIKV